MLRITRDGGGTNSVMNHDSLVWQFLHRRTDDFWNNNFNVYNRDEPVDRTANRIMFFSLIGCDRWSASEITRSAEEFASKLIITHAYNSLKTSLSEQPYVTVCYKPLNQHAHCQVLRIELQEVQWSVYTFLCRVVGVFICLEIMMVNDGDTCC